MQSSHREQAGLEGPENVMLFAANEAGGMNGGCCEGEGEGADGDDG